MKPAYKQSLVIDMLAIFKKSILRMRSAGKLAFKQNQELEGRTLFFKILCETIYISNMRVGLEQV